MPPPLENRLLAREVAISGAKMLARMVMPTGRFVYSFEPAAPDIQSLKYNTLRHAGSAWSMFDVARHLGPLPEVVSAASNAVEYMKKTFLQPFGESGAKCMVDGETVKLGGAGLAILALLEHHRVADDDSSLDAAKALADYVIQERLSNGDFVHSRLYPSLEVRPFKSGYYVGEALFALARLYGATGDDRLITVAADSAQRLSATGYGVKEHSHWMTYALAEMYRIEPQKRWLRHAGKIAARIIKEPGYRDSGNSTSIACQTEGLMAYAGLLGEEVGTPGPSRAAVLETVRQNLALQLRFRLANGAFIAGIGQSKVRIDNIQHNISSFLAYSKFSTDLSDQYSG